MSLVDKVKLSQSSRFLPQARRIVVSEDENGVKPDGQNSAISFVITKWLLPELSIPAAGQKDRRLWGREWSCGREKLLMSGAMKSDTNEHTVRGRPTLKVFKRFRKGSVCKAYERSTIYERIYQESCYAKGASYQPGLSTLRLDENHLQKRHRIFRRDREPSRIPG